MRNVEPVILLGVTLLCMVWPVRAADPPRNLKTFTNKAGWIIKYPKNWQVGSCNNCSDPTDPDVFVTFFDPSTSGMITINHLADKPSDQSVEEWLNDTKKIAVANPRLGEQWISLDGTRALRVKTLNPDSTEAENVYVVYGSSTFFIQASPVGNAAFYRTYKRMLSNFRFTKH